MSCPMRRAWPRLPQGRSVHCGNAVLCLSESFAETSVVLVSASSVRRGFGGLGPVVDFPGVGKHFLLSACLQICKQLGGHRVRPVSCRRRGSAGGSAGRAEGSAPSPGSSPLRDPCSLSLGQSLGLAPQHHPLQFAGPSSSHLCPITELEFIPTGSWVV